jgi:hypothetical protein
MIFEEKQDFTYLLSNLVDLVAELRSRKLKKKSFKIKPIKNAINFETICEKNSSTQRNKTPNMYSNRTKHEYEMNADNEKIFLFATHRTNDSSLHSELAQN